MDGGNFRDYRRLHGGDGEEEVEEKAGPLSSGVACSICLEFVSYSGGRSRAKLQCGHEFHLDCIGSAFNMKGAMQCPNCRKVENGQWLYGNGTSHQLHELSMDELIPEEDFYDLSYSVMPYRGLWCPFGTLAQVVSFEEVESISTTYHDSMGDHPIYAELIAAPSVTQSYVAYVGPVSLLPTSTRSNEDVDVPTANQHWNGLSGHNEIVNHHNFSAINVNYHSRGHHSPPFSSGHLNGTDPASAPPLTLRSSDVESGTRTMTTSFPHPSYPTLFVHGSGSAAGSSFVCSGVPCQSSGSALIHSMIPTPHIFPHWQQQSTNSRGFTLPVVHGPRDSLVAIRAPPQHDHSGGIFINSISGSSSQNLHEAVSFPSHAWGTEFLSHSQHSNHQYGGTSNSDTRSSVFW